MHYDTSRTEIKKMSDRELNKALISTNKAYESLLNEIDDKDSDFPRYIDKERIKNLSDYQTALLKEIHNRGLQPKDRLDEEVEESCGFSFEKGTSGLVKVGDNMIDYSFKDSRLTLKKDGKTVFDKEVIIDPTKKYRIDYKNNEYSVEECSVANMLPETNNDGILRKESTDDIYIHLSETTIDFINNDLYDISMYEKACSDSKVNIKTDINISDTVKNDLMELDILKLKLENLNEDPNKNKFKINDVKREIIRLESEVRGLTVHLTPEEKVEIKKIKKDMYKVSKSKIS